jgi:glycosyltransferase involved in cell wall biosynthesis
MSLVSVVIPAHNAQRYLPAALESVFAQTLLPLEVIVVDDGSTDQTSAVAKQFAVRLESQPRAGAAQARNCGIAVAAGEFLAFLDADDLWLPEKLATQHAYLLANPQCDLVFCGIEQFISPDTPEVGQQVLSPLGIHHFPSPSVLFVRREVFTQIGVFPNFAAGEWMTWLATAQKAGLQSQMLDECLARRRIHHHNFSRSAQAQVRQGYLQMLRHKVQQERQNA